MNDNGQVGDGTTTQRTTPVSVSGQPLPTLFIYDGDGSPSTARTIVPEAKLSGRTSLVKKIKPDNSKTLYVAGIYEGLDRLDLAVDKNSAGMVVNTKTYYPAAGATLAPYASAGVRNGSTLYYVLKNHLGSASVVTNSSGTIVGEDRFYPLGETRFTSGTMFTDKLYTGQREITGLGIYHYGARFYSPKLGRFLSADTIVPGLYNPQNLNRYSYVINNPLKYTDPTRHMQSAGDDGGCSPCTQLPDPEDPPNNNDDEEDGSGSDYCSTHLGACGTPPTIPEVTTPTITTPTPAEGGANDYSCFNNPSACGSGNATPSSSSEDHGSPLVSIAGALLLVNLGILDTVLAIGIGAVAITALTVPGAQLGLVGELVLVPLEFVSLNLTIYAAQMAATGSTDHDPLPILHAVFPNFLPYEP